MTDADFMRRIIAEPGEDVHRLVFADWLECERVHPQPERADFIRCQIQIAQAEEAIAILSKGEFMILPESPKGRHLKWIRGEVKKLRHREDNLLERHGGDWLPLVWDVWDKSSADQPPASLTFSNRGGPSGVMVFTRGFVSEIRLSLAAWLGEECSGCVNVPAAAKYRCPLCQGTGYVGGCGPAIVRSQPIERVTCPEKRPGRLSLRDNSVVGWGRSERPLVVQTEDELPACVFDLLPASSGGITWGTTGGVAAALDALSTTLLAWAKRPRSPPTLRIG